MRSQKPEVDAEAEVDLNTGRRLQTFRVDKQSARRSALPAVPSGATECSVDIAGLELSPSLLFSLYTPVHSPNERYRGHRGGERSFELNDLYTWNLRAYNTRTHTNIHILVHTNRQSEKFRESASHPLLVELLRPHSTRMAPVPSAPPPAASKYKVNLCILLSVGLHSFRGHLLIGAAHTL